MLHKKKPLSIRKFNNQYHEPANEMPESDRDIVRALTSLKEEVEATNWYHQRIVTCENEELKEILIHNRNEEIEHIAMTLEWLRRKMDDFDKILKEYLFKNKNIVETEKKTKQAAEYNGKKVKLNDPIRNPSGSRKKFHVFVKDPTSEKIKKVQFGDPNMEIKRDNPERRRNFRARHKCDSESAKDRTKPKYWSCYQWRKSKKVNN